MTNFQIAIIVLFTLSGIINGAAMPKDESPERIVLKSIFAPIVVCYLIGRTICKILYNE